MIALPALPMVDHLDRIRDLLTGNLPVILEAPPGTGKTTLVPLALLQEPWLKGRRIVVLQPRRVAVRAAAARMAELLGEPVGGTVGYRIRFEARTSRAARIEVITEGLLTRMLQDDPSLEGVGAVIFDEFHERSLHSDLGLLLAQEARESLRGDLRLLVMSATLGDTPVEKALPGARRVAIQGQTHALTIVHRPDCPRSEIAGRAAAEAAQALLQASGDILVFLPGRGDIERAQAALTARRLPEGVRVIRLYGELPVAEQVRAILPDPQGLRKVVLATPIAETSVTIEGVTTVIDTGFEKAGCFDAGAGLNRLVTRRISQDSAAQRAGRAGRTVPGVCVRLWSGETQRALRPSRAPEILESDLAGAVLELAVWGRPELEKLRWITPPPGAAVDQARELLRRIGALDAGGAATSFGRELAALGAHPRIGAMLVQARRFGLARLGCLLAGLLEERDILPEGAADTADIEARIRRLESRGVKGGRSDGVLRAAAGWKARLVRMKAPAQSAEAPATPAGFLLAVAYPERIAVRRGAAGTRNVRYLLAQGKGVLLRSDDPLSRSEFITAAGLRDAPKDGQVLLAAELEASLLAGPLSQLVSLEERVAWDEERGGVKAARVRSCGAIMLAEEPLAAPPPELVRAAVLGALRAAGGAAVFDWSREARALQARAAAAQRHRPEAGWPDLSDEALNGVLAELLEGRWPALTRRAAWAQLHMEELLRQRLSWQQRQELDRVAPAELMLPNGKPRRLDYAGAQGAVLAATVQELFGWQRTPRLGSGEIPLIIEVLSPARRPVQVTGDLEGFWRKTYPQVRKELRGRYPKHRWPEDPTAA